MMILVLINQIQKQNKNFSTVLGIHRRKESIGTSLGLVLLEREGEVAHQTQNTERTPGKDTITQGRVTEAVTSSAQESMGERDASQVQVLIITDPMQINSHLDGKERGLIQMVNVERVTINKQAQHIRIRKAVRPKGQRNKVREQLVTTY